MIAEVLFLCLATMPILWRFLLKQFFTSFSLAFLGFIGLGILIRHKNFASLIAEGVSFQEALYYALFLLSNTLAIVLALSSLIAAFLVSYHLSKSSEILSLRAAGFTLTDILFPIYAVGILLTGVNFVIISEITPYTKIAAEKIHSNSYGANPLTVLTKKLPKELNAPYIEMNLKKGGSKATDLIVIYHNRELDRLTLFAADSLYYKKGHPLRGDHITTISHIPLAEGFDHLIIESQKTIHSEPELLSSYLKKPPNLAKLDMCTLKDLIKSKHARKKLEILHRASKALIVFSFILLGSSFGLFIGKKFPEMRYLGLFLLSSFAFLCIFFARKSKLQVELAIFSLVFPHLLIFMISTLQQIKLIRGKST